MFEQGEGREEGCEVRREAGEGDREEGGGEVRREV